MDNIATNGRRDFCFQEKSGCEIAHRRQQNGGSRRENLCGYHGRNRIGRIMKAVEKIECERHCDDDHHHDHLIIHAFSRCKNTAYKFDCARTYTRMPVNVIWFAKKRGFWPRGFRRIYRC